MRTGRIRIQVMWSHRALILVLLVFGPFVPGRGATARAGGERSGQPTTTVRGHGLRIDLLTGRYGEVVRPEPPGALTLRAATFQLPPATDVGLSPLLRRLARMRSPSSTGSMIESARVTWRTRFAHQPDHLHPHAGYDSASDSLGLRDFGLRGGPTVPRFHPPLDDSLRADRRYLRECGGELPTKRYRQ
jgi:hypothetical protein